jgi:hypothetical protein
MFLYLPTTKRAITVELIASIDEVMATVDDLSQKKGTRQVPAVNVTMHGAPLVAEAEGDEEVEVPFYETYTGQDREILLAWRDANLIRLIQTSPDEAVQCPLPASMVEPEPVEVGAE